MTDYTPTTAQVCMHYASSRNMVDIQVPLEEGLAEFDRWLAAHDAQVLETAARKIQEAQVEESEGFFDAITERVLLEMARALRGPEEGS